MGKDVNLNSVDAMFATVLLKLDGQDKMLERIEAQTLKTNGRVTALEEAEKTRKVRMATAATIFSAIGGSLVWLADKFL